MSLLAILSLGGKQGMSRHRIEAYFWSESTAERARHALDQAVYAIRRDLGSDVILATGQELKLNPEFVRADVWEFDDAIRTRQFAAAVGIYKGPLLDGFHFGESRELEARIDAERARVLLAYQIAIEFLADRSAEAGDHSQDVTWRRRLASSDPLSAGPTKKLMLALAAAGDRAGAVKHARQYQELVRQELEMEPDSEIERLISTLSHPATTESIVERAPPGPAAIAAPLRTPFRLARSRVVALASVPVIAALAIGAFMVKTEDARRPASSASASTGQSMLPLPAARDAYLRGISAWEDRTKEGSDSAVVYFRRAAEIDPGYAEAYAGLAEAYVRIGYFGYRPAEAMYPKAKAAALRSMQLDSTLASAHAALATALVWEHDFGGAESEYLQAIALEPTNSGAHQWYGVLLMILGRAPEAVAETKRAAELAPLSLQAQSNYGAFLNCSGEHAAALRQFQKAVGEEPDSAWVSRNAWVLANMSRVYADNGQYANAMPMINRALRIVPGNPRALHTLTVIYDEMGRSDLARQAFARADTSSEHYATYRGMVYGGAGKADSAFLWFDRVKKWGIMNMLAIQCDTHMGPVRSDPRYSELLARLGIPTHKPMASRKAAR